MYLHVLKELIGVFGFGFNDDNFNFVVVVEKIGYEFALGHVEYPLLDSRHCQLLLDAGHSAILGQLDICAQSTVGQIRYRCVSLYRCNEI